MTFQKGLGIALLIYLAGMTLQELGSFVDRNITNVYTGMHRSILKGNLDDEYRQETSSKIIKNPVVLNQYRKVAKNLLKDYIQPDDEAYIENEYMNGYVFSACQYYVSVRGKDKKVEKMGALFSMAKTLMSCFFLLAIIAAVSIFFNAGTSIPISSMIGLSIHGCEHCINKVFLVIIFSRVVK